MNSAKNQTVFHRPAMSGNTSTVTDCLIRCMYGRPHIAEYRTCILMITATLGSRRLAKACFSCFFLSALNPGAMFIGLISVNFFLLCWLYVQSMKIAKAFVEPLLETVFTSPRGLVKPCRQRSTRAFGSVSPDGRCKCKLGDWPCL